MEELAMPTQLGSGLNGGATDSAHLASTTPYAYSMMRNKTLFQLYVDVVDAFGSLCRIALHGDLESEEQWRTHLVNCGFEPADVDDIIGLA